MGSEEIKTFKWTCDSPGCDATAIVQGQELPPGWKYASRKIDNFYGGSHVTEVRCEKCPTKD